MYMYPHRNKTDHCIVVLACSEVLQLVHAYTLLVHVIHARVHSICAYSTYVCTCRFSHLHMSTSMCVYSCASNTVYMYVSTVHCMSMCLHVYVFR